MRAVLALFAATIITISASLPAGAQVSQRDREAFKEIISSQIQAFEDDDAERAFSYAVPALRERFGSPERFMKIIRENYPPVFLPRRYVFGDVSNELDRPTQQVRLEGPHGRSWIALYAFERYPHAGWKIAGVTLRPIDRTEGAKVFPPEGLPDKDAHAGSGEPLAGRLVAKLAPEGGDVQFAASFDPKTEKLVVINVGKDADEDKDFELWFIEGKKPPVSLGLVGAKDLKAPSVPAKLQSAFAAGGTLAISVEPKGGSTTGAPTGPVVATGALKKL